jgi:hypothetical protein
VAAALKSFEAYIDAETLCVEMKREAAAGALDEELNGRKCKLLVKKA